MTELTEYVQQQLHAGRTPKEIRAMLIKNGYSVYDVEKALGRTDSKKVSKPLLLLAGGAALLIVGIVLLIRSL